MSGRTEKKEDGTHALVHCSPHARCRHWAAACSPRRTNPLPTAAQYVRERRFWGSTGALLLLDSSSSREGSGEEANNATALFFFPFFPSLLWVYHNVLRFQSGQTCHQRCSILCFYSKKSCSSRRTRVFCSHLFPFSSYLSLSRCADQRLRCTVLLISFLSPSLPSALLHASLSLSPSSLSPFLFFSSSYASARVLPTRRVDARGRRKQAPSGSRRRMPRIFRNNDGKKQRER